MGCESSSWLELELVCKKVSDFSVVRFSGLCKATIPSYSLPVASWCYMWHHTDIRTWWPERAVLRSSWDMFPLCGSSWVSPSLKTLSIVFWIQFPFQYLPIMFCNDQGYPHLERDPSYGRVVQFGPLRKDFGRSASDPSSKRSSEEEAVCSLSIWHGSGQRLPSGNDEHSCGKSHFLKYVLTRKSTFSMVMFNSYVELPEGTVLGSFAEGFASKTANGSTSGTNPSQVCGSPFLTHTRHSILHPIIINYPYDRVSWIHILYLVGGLEHV